MRVQTKPESCWYDANRYALKYKTSESSNGSAERLLVHADHGRELSAHPQCHLSMELSVLHDANGRSQLDFTPRLRGFSEATAEEWNFVKPSTTVGPDDDLDSINSFTKLTGKDSTHYAELNMGPDIDETGNIKYTTEAGIPSYLHIRNDWKRKQSHVPDYCGHHFSKTVRWIQFQKAGTFVVAYTNVRVGRCVMGVSYDLEGLVHMLSIDRWVQVIVK